MDLESNDNKPIYLQPYLQFSKRRTPWPVTEMLGPFVGYSATKPRLPKEDGGTSAAATLWKVSQERVAE